LRIAVKGVLKSMKTIMTEKIWRLFPDMYMPVGISNRKH